VKHALVSSDRAPGLSVAAGVVIPDDANISPGVTLHAGVELGPGVELGQGAIVGRPQRIDRRSRTPLAPEAPPTVLGEGASVGAYSVVVAGARIGAGAYLGDHALLREGAFVGEEAVIGQAAAVGHSTRIGARSRLQTRVSVGPWTVIEDDVFVGGDVLFVSDATMGRRDPHAAAAGIVVRRAARIGTGAIIFSPVEVGEEAVVGAASLVRRDVPARAVVAGTPARHLRAVRDDELLERWPYPRAEASND
jgi:acetyltransferase-like isoleucine patch superfamily enzyme